MSYTPDFLNGTTGTTAPVVTPTAPVAAGGMNFVSIQALMAQAIRLDREDTEPEHRPAMPAPSWQVPGRPWRYGDPQHSGEHAVAVWEQMIEQAHVAGMISFPQAMRLVALAGAWATALDLGSCKEPKVIEGELELP